MKKNILAGTVIFILLAGISFGAETAKRDPNQLFYNANSYYEKGDYAKAIEEYLAILDMGVENGRLYYNIGNGFLKMGKAGYAILCYEKARRFMPQDSDLNSNLAYARSLTEGSNPDVFVSNPVARIIKKPFEDISLNIIAILAVIFYLSAILVLVLSLLNPVLARRFRLLVIMFIVLVLLTVAAFGVRYYDEAILKHGIVVQKGVECKYEPIDKSTTYYTLREGSEVRIMRTRNGWHQIRRFDGKIAWVKKDAIEDI